MALAVWNITVFFVPTSRDVVVGVMKDAALGFREEAGAGGCAELAGVPLDDGTCCGLGGVVDPSGHIAMGPPHLEHRDLDRHSRLRCPLLKQLKHLPNLRRISFLVSIWATVLHVVEE